MIDLGHEKDVDLDPKKPKRNTKLIINLHVDILEARVAIRIDLLLINVNVLKIERKNNMTEVDSVIDTAQDIIGTIEIIKTIKTDLKTCRVSPLHRFLQILMIF